MIILGLGSNLGDRLGHLRQALSLLRASPDVRVQRVSPVYLSDALLPENAPDNWNIPYLNAAILCESSLNPHALLRELKKIEVLIDRQPEKHWGPRVIDIDILAWDNLTLHDEVLEIPHTSLHERPFALWPLADLAPFWVAPIDNPHYQTAAERVRIWGSRFTGEAPFHTRQIQQRIDTPQLMGILNLTADSFSDGGRYLQIDQAVAQLQQLVLDGADIIDIGAEATGPGAVALSSTQEWQRLAESLPVLLKTSCIIPPKISLDTQHATTAARGLEMGVDWINDQSGLTNSAMVGVLKNASCDVVFMHQLGLPVDKSKTLSLSENGVATVHAWAEQQMRMLPKSRLIFDVGIGFGKSAEQSLEILQKMNMFKDLRMRLLIGHSRKSFLKLFTNVPAAQRDLETVAVSLALQDHVDYLRVHNVAAHAAVFKTNKVFENV